ncbi:MAG: NUDIX domain-containing protein [Clostridiaceae bacterium]|nr:NUDIX domain-containing protein [Clostridiaceae bacterium]
MKIKNSIECYIVREGSKGSIEVLLLHKPETNRHPAFWQPITGGIENNEKPIDACIREVKEEANLLMNLEILKDLNYKFEISLKEDDLVIKKSLFMCRGLDPALQVKISDEHDDFMWVRLEEVSGYLFWDSNKNTFKELYKVITKD